MIVSRVSNKQGMRSNLNSVTEERVWDVEERETREGKNGTSQVKKKIIIFDQSS